MRREIKEELGIEVVALERVGFFLHPDKIVLGYRAVIPRDIPLNPSDPGHEIGIWKTKSEVRELLQNEVYLRFVLENWPVK